MTLTIEEYEDLKAKAETNVIHIGNRMMEDTMHWEVIKQTLIIRLLLNPEYFKHKKMTVPTWGGLSKVFDRDDLKNEIERLKKES